MTCNLKSISVGANQIGVWPMTPTMLAPSVGYQSVAKANGEKNLENEFRRTLKRFSCAPLIYAAVSAKFSDDGQSAITNIETVLVLNKNVFVLGFRIVFAIIASGRLNQTSDAILEDDPRACDSILLCCPCQARRSLIRLVRGRGQNHGAQ